jgi:glycerol-3-phosphate acyltransferase PlsY
VKNRKKGKNSLKINYQVFKSFLFSLSLVLELISFICSGVAAIVVSALAFVSAIGVIATQRMSVGSIMGAGTFPIVCWFIEPSFIAVGTAMAIIILVKHRANIGRLIRGEEPKMSFKKK